MPVTGGTPVGWQGSSTPHVTYRIEHADASPIELAGKIIWREPPVMLAISYSDASSSVPSNQPVLQQLLGGMQLAEASAGILFSPLLADPPAGQAWTDIIQPDQHAYSKQLRGQTSVYLYKLAPDLPLDLLRQRLHAALQHATEALSERPALACHGILLDRDTVNASRRNDQPGNVLCPKPHIGPGVFDLVDDRLHCLKNPRLCHVYGQPITPPFVIRVDTLEGLDKKSVDLRARSEEKLREAEDSGNEDRAEQLRGHIFLGVGRTVEQYVQIHGNTTSLEEHFEQWIFGDYWKKHQRSLSEETRNNLLSGEYVWEEYKRAKGLNDWAAPAIQYCRALEKELNRRLHDYYPKYKYYPDVGQKGFSREMTLGFLSVMYILQGQDPYKAHSPKEQDEIRKAQDDWHLCRELVKRAGCNLADLENIIKWIAAEEIAKKRNNLAHGGIVPQSDAWTLRNVIIGQKGKLGILIWLAENLEPKT
jgi:hypothetical protein